MYIGVSGFVSTGIYPFNRNRVPEYYFSTFDTSKTITSMEKASPNMALTCATSTAVTDSQNVLPLSAELSLSILRTILPSDTSPREITSSRLLKKIGRVPKIPKKCSIKKIATPFFIIIIIIIIIISFFRETNNMEEKRKKQTGSTIRSREI